jgi:hypothetical protein
MRKFLDKIITIIMWLLFIITLIFFACILACIGLIILPFYLTWEFLDYISAKLKKEERL